MRRVGWDVGRLHRGDEIMKVRTHAIFLAKEKRNWDGRDEVNGEKTYVLVP